MFVFLFLRQLVHLLVLSSDMLVFPQLDGEKMTVFSLHSNILCEIPILDHCFLCISDVGGRNGIRR